MGSIPEITTVPNTREFFFRLVQGASTKPLVPEVEFYLVELLCNPPHYEQPLAEILREASEAPPTSRVKNFKLLGDISLVVSGLWPDSLKNKPVKIDYFVSMGQTGYNNAAEVAKNHLRDITFYDFYSRLCDEFPVCREVLEKVAGALRPL